MNRSMREMLWSINPDHDNLKNFEEFCIRYAEEYFERTTISFQHISNVQDPESSLYAEVRYNLLLILKEGFHNCAKHSQANLVILTINANSRFIHLIIQDNGIGLLPDAPEGYGLKSIRKRVEKLKGEVLFHSQGQGTQIDVRIITSS